MARARCTSFSTLLIYMPNVETAGCCSLECQTLVFIAGGVANFASAACWALVFFAGAKEGVVKGMHVGYLHLHYFFLCRSRKTRAWL